MIEISFTDSIYGSNNRNVEIQKVLKEIKTERWKKQIDEIRYHNSNGDIEKAKVLKRKLPAFTISATYKGKREEENIESYSGLLHLDYDYIDNVQELKAKIVDIPNTYAAFISPSGNGLKVLVKSDNILSAHTFTFNALKKYYDGIVGIDSDSAVKDFPRICFVSYDPDLYLNEDAEVFKYQAYPNNETKSEKDIGWVWDFTSNKQEFTDGNRNNFVHSFACNANRYDYDINETLNYAYTYDDGTFSKAEIAQAVKSAYKNNVNEKGSAAKPAKPAILQSDVPQKITTPYIPCLLYTSDAADE